MLYVSLCYVHDSDMLWYEGVLLIHSHMQLATCRAQLAQFLADGSVQQSGQPSAPQPVEGTNGNTSASQAATSSCELDMPLLTEGYAGKAYAAGHVLRVAGHVLRVAGLDALCGHATCVSKAGT